MELNHIYHMDNREGLKKLPEKCANLIISDPPYFEVKGEFDFVWKDFDEYLKFMEEQAQLYKRILADNGTLFVYGHAKRIAYVQVIFDKYFNLENNITIEFNRQTKKAVETFRCFAPVSERALMYSGGNTFGDYLKKARYKKGLSTINVAESGKFYGTVNHGGAVSNWEKGESVPSEQQYSELSSILDLDRSFEQSIRPFTNRLKLFDVMRFDQESHVTRNYDHDTVKPEKLTRALILTCSRKDDLIVVPFAGSGTECAMAAKEGRRFIGFDVNPDYVDMGNKRASEQTRQIRLFIK